MSSYEAAPRYHRTQVLYFGIELELLVSGRGKTHKTWHALAAEVSDSLARAGVANHVREAGALEDYSEWSIVQEVTIASWKGVCKLFCFLWDRFKSCLCYIPTPQRDLVTEVASVNSSCSFTVGLELVSPVLSASDSYAAPPWAATLSHVFNTLHASFHLHNSSSTSSHIHLSLSPQLNASQLCALAKSTLLFESALDSLVAPSRRGSSSYWTQSSRSASPALRGHNMAQCFDILDACLDTKSSDVGGDDEAMHAIVRTMNLYPHHSATGRAQGRTSDFVHGGVFKWNLAGLLSDGSGTGTVEFRQPPGSMSAAEARAWVVLAVGFVAGAVGLHEDGTDVAARDGGVEQLWRLVGRGVRASGVAGDVESLFAGQGAGERRMNGKKQRNKEKTEEKKGGRGWLWRG